MSSTGKKFFWFPLTALPAEMIHFHIDLHRIDDSASMILRHRAIIQAPMAKAVVPSKACGLKIVTRKWLVRALYI